MEDKASYPCMYHLHTQESTSRSADWEGGTDSHTIPIYVVSSGCNGGPQVCIYSVSRPPPPTPGQSHKALNCVSTTTTTTVAVGPEGASGAGADIGGWSV